MGLVTVRNKGDAAVSLALYDQVENEAGGKAFRQSTEHQVIVLHPGDNQVEEEFIDAWLAQNAKSHLVTGETVKKCLPQRE